MIIMNHSLTQSVRYVCIVFLVLITIAIVIIPIIIANLRPHQVFQVSDLRPSLRGSTPVCSHLQPQPALTLHLFIFITPVQCAGYVLLNITISHLCVCTITISVSHCVALLNTIAVGHAQVQCNLFSTPCPVQLVECNAPWATIEIYDAC